MGESTIDGFIELMNRYCSSGEAFLFIIDFGMNHPEIHKLSSLPPGIKFSTPLISNLKLPQIYPKSFIWEKEPVSFSYYKDAFLNVMTNIRNGNTYLLNLTFPTRLTTDLSLTEILHASSAKYKLLYHDRFVVFSPETFVRIRDGVISSYPMKGTIDASLDNAEYTILSDEKEMAEHNTIVDLIRNDLSIFSDDVSVTRYRYVERIETNGKALLQVSSEITGVLPDNYRGRIGEIITGMLPAGSVTGAPKKETIRIILESEKYERRWYTGVFGVFDGRSLDSAVMIRYIEKDSGQLIFKSGGGITSLSDMRKEYEELISKVYVPLG